MEKQLDALVQKLQAVRADTLRMMDTLADAEWTRPGVVGEWTARDLVAHFISAERGMTKLAQRFAQGEMPKTAPDFNMDFYNRRQIEKRAGMTLAEIRAELEAAHRELLAFMDTLTPEQLAARGEHPVYGEMSLEGLLNVIYTHERDHLNAWREAGGKL
jgi:uncharacterized protein (TIGR03083 family)